MISVIIPVFNAEKWLPDCLASLNRQTCQNFETILIDDGSHDSSGKLCDEFARCRPRVQVVHRPNGGPGAARNSGLDVMTGDKVFFLDADDSLPDDALATLADASQRTGADLVIGGFTRILAHGTAETMPLQTDSENACSLLDADGIAALARHYLNAPNRHLQFAYPWGRLYHADIIVRHRLRFRENIVNCEDVAFNFAYLTHADKLFLLNKTVYLFTVHNNCSSLTLQSQQHPERLFGFLAIFDTIIHFAAVRGFHEQPHLSQYCITMSIISLVRLGCSLSCRNFAATYRFVARLLHDPSLRSALPRYSRPAGGSRLIPWLIRWRCPSLLLLVAHVKGIKRYGKNGTKRT